MSEAGMNEANGGNVNSGDLMCVWKPRRSGLTFNGMQLCEACEDEFVREGRMCASCRQIDMDLECRRLSAASLGPRLTAEATPVARPHQPRVQMGVVPMRRSWPWRMTLGAFAVGCLVCAAMLAACVWIVL